MNVQDDAFASYKLLARALEKRGYSVAVNANPLTKVTFTGPAGASWTTKAANMRYPFNSEEMCRLSWNKNLAYEFVEKSDFSVPYTLKIEVGESRDDELAGALATFKKLIVKPNDASLSKGLTVGITTLSALKRAIEDARTVSSSVLVQQQVEGEEIRFTILDGKVVAAILRETAQVIGDGQSTVAQLIARENDARLWLQFECIGYPQLDETLIDSAFLHSDRVPDDGEIVKLSHSTMIRGGCSVYDVLSEVDTSYIQKIEAMAAKLDANFFVVDVFCKDHRQPAASDNYWFIEFNTAPVLKVYYGCRDDKQFDIVSHLASAIDNYLQINGQSDHNKQGKKVAA